MFYVCLSVNHAITAEQNLKQFGMEIDSKHRLSLYIIVYFYLLVNLKSSIAK